MTPNHSSIVVALVQLTANVFGLLIIDKFGRKILLVTSAFASAFGLICSALYTLYADQLIEFKWISIVSLSSTIFVQTMGVNTLYALLLNEILPRKVIIFSLSFAIFQILFHFYSD